jgi:hypothetical protein
MKAAPILAYAHGQLAGVLVHVYELEARLRSTQAVLEDVASGLTPLDGMDEVTAEVLSQAMVQELLAVCDISGQLRALQRSIGRPAPIPFKTISDLGADDLRATGEAQRSFGPTSEPAPPVKPFLWHGIR